LPQESLKEKDQAIRKYEQELDSLTFRNQQLSSRVSVLQQDLDDSDAKAKKNKVLHEDVMS
jgi:protein phosphatase 1 regulatory subunit 21